MSGQFHAPAALRSKTAPGNQWMKWCLPSKGVVNDAEKREFLALPRIELHHHEFPSNSQSLQCSATTRTFVQVCNRQLRIIYFRMNVNIPQDGRQEIL
jgi:hypothetical protein